MSKVVKGVTKVFKKVVNVAKKVLPVALAVGAAVFTGGAALGIGGMAGGWGAAVSGVVSKLGAGSLLSSVLTGAVTQAGYGALMGGAISSISGGSFSRGAQMGAMGGAVTGGIMGGMGLATDPLSGIGQDAASQAANQAAGGAQAFPVDTASNITQTALNPAQTAQSIGQAVQAPAQSATSGGGGLLSNVFKQGGWLERNQMLAGSVIGGLGQGLMARGQAEAQAEAEMDLLHERHRLDAANYQGADPGAGFTPIARGTSEQSPTERFDRRIYSGWQYEYNPQTGKIERVPVQTG